ncbi:Uncharacterised protein [Helicobacter fennelliae]|uniref:Integral membrane protein n=1 Tax=Helicobacter fennelliae TaxID=215 RepID=A0A2X3EIG4_9HELI|nr:Uncharacterised protein [Helicobacter fennelliae]
MTGRIYYLNLSTRYLFRYSLSVFYIIYGFIYFIGTKPTDIVLSFFMFMITLPLVFYYCRILFYNRKNKVYVTEQGIGFEKRVWFKIQKKIF